MEQSPEIVQKPWGSYPANRRQQLIRFIVKIGLSHGSVKDLMQRLWYLDGAKQPADIIHQGVKFRLYPWDNVKDSKILFGSTVQDSMELSFLKHRLTENAVFVDIGANIGYYSCILASNRVGRIIAVEPHPHTLQRLTFNVALNHFDDIIEVAPYALGDTEKEVLLNEAEGSLGASSILEHHHAAKKQYSVNMMPFHKLCRKYAISTIDALKIDVEGVEDLVLMPFFESAPPSLWPKCIVIEHGHQKDWQRDLLGFLNNNGYRVQKRNDSNTILTLTDK